MRLQYLLLMLATSLLWACSTADSTVQADLVAPDDIQGTFPDSSVPDAVLLPEIHTKDGGQLDIQPDFAGVDEDLTPAGCQPGEGCFQDPCVDNSQCLSGWCVEHMGEGVCTDICVEECPAGWSCKLVAGRGSDPVSLCISAVSNLCKPCQTGANCTSSGQEDPCLDYGDEGSFCGSACATPEDCPWGFNCQAALTVDGLEVLQCVAEAGVCPCTARAIELALWTPCEQVNEHGACAGMRVCGEEGLGNCDAAAPTAESCNGVDDDCDGDIDEPDDIAGEFIPLCNDDNECTQDLCNGAAGCDHVQLNEGECKDGDSCTVGDHCEEGQCIGNPVICDDQNPCTDDSCDGLGGCLFENNTADCDDLSPCTVADQCEEGQCAGFAVDCQCLTDGDCLPLEDGDLCNGSLFCDTTALPYQCAMVPGSVVECPQPPDGPDAICLQAECDPLSGTCSLIPHHEAGACDDGNPCTVGERCVMGVCSQAVVTNCEDGNPCTDDGCDPLSGCTHLPNELPCQDNDACTIGDSCQDTLCVPGTGTLDCHDDNPCTKDECDPILGCVHEAIEGECDDGNACTQGDQCAGGMCLYESLLDCDDQDVCTTDFCDPAGGCGHTLNDSPCDDGDICTLGDHCHLGLCISSSSMLCDDVNPCTTNQCNPLTGCEFVANDAPCDDGNLCTADDQCGGGWCLSGPPVLCDDQNMCTDDSCNPDTGCLFENNQEPCDDNDQCTVGDQCDLGECQPGPGSLPCDDLNVCTDDSCLPAEGCAFVPNDAPCSDDDECTVGDQCADSQCQAGADTLDCDDTNPCTDDFCLPDSGCLNANNTAPCEDGMCKDGACVAGCEAAFYGTAGIGINNGWTCTNVCAVGGGVSVDWTDHQEQVDYCHLLHPGAIVFTANPSSFSYPIYEPQNDRCKLNQNGVQGQNYAGNGSAAYGDQILCKCENECPCIPACQGKECGEDGCEGICGTCPAGEGCDETQQCVPVQSGSETYEYTGSIVAFSVPAGVTELNIEAWGAEGGTNPDKGHPGGLGAKVEGTMAVAPGTALKILVGGKGQDGIGNAGGGGGSFVWTQAGNQLLMAAGGGGAGGWDTAGEDGVSTENGTHGFGLSDGAGINGDGAHAPAGSNWHGGGGAGWKTNGNTGFANNGPCTEATQAIRPLEGGMGGIHGGEPGYVGDGGFGGGGGGQGGCTASGGGGGGGGYSGGGPGGYLAPLIRGGGGGGSFNPGSDQSNASGVRVGNGLVVISW